VEFETYLPISIHSKHMTLYQQSYSSVQQFLAIEIYLTWNGQ
jgi:hypothetical protein